MAGLGLGLLLPRITAAPTVASSRVAEALIGVGFGVLGLVSIIFSLLFLVVQWALPPSCRRSAADSCWITSGRMTPDHREVADRELLGAVQPPGDRGPALRRRGVQQAGEQGLCLQQDHGRVGAGLDEIV